MDTANVSSISTRARPVRIAYLLSAEEGADGQITAAFADALSRWGGRFSLCVPVAAGEISARYLSWLSEFDPDVIEVLAPISKATLAAIDRISTAFRMTRAPSTNEHVRLETSRPFLNSLTTLPQLVMQPLLPTWQGQSRYVLDGTPQFHDNFILDNFGTPTASFGNNLPPHLFKFAHSVFLTRSPNPIAQLSEMPSDFLVNDEVQFLRQLGTGPAVVTLSQLASHRGFQLTWPNPSWTDRFTLVVGDSSVDRICYWNSRMLAASWSYSSATSLRVPPERLNDTDFCLALATVLESRVALGFPLSGVPTMNVRSHSVDLPALKPLCEKLRREMRIEFVYSEIRDSDDVVPTGPRQDHVSYLEERESEEVMHQREAKIVMPIPLHIAENGEHMPGQDGEWLVDCKISRVRDYSRYANVGHEWLFPRRPQPPSLFFPDDEARVDDFRRLTVRTSIKKRAKKLSIPEENHVFRSFFLSDVSYYRYRDDARQEVCSSPSPYEMKTGDKGQVLNGTIGLFGGLKGALNYLGMRFWRNFLLSLAAPNRDPERLKNVASRLRQRLAGSGQSLITLGSDADWERLAKATIEVSGTIRVPRSFTTLDAVAQAWSDEVEAVGKTEPKLVEHLNAYERKKVLEESFGSLRDLGVFAQGRKWRCVECGYQNWTSVSDLRELPQCVVCKEEVDLPLSFEWDFRLNDFLASSLREYDSVSLLSALTHLWLKAERSFYFRAPTEFMMNHLPDWRRFVPDFEVDLLCVVDGKLVMVECKESGRTSSDDLQKLAVAATALMPEKILLASLMPNSRLDARANQLKALVNSLGIEVETLQGMPAEWSEPNLHLQ